MMESSLEAPNVMLCSVPIANRKRHEGCYLGLPLDFHEGWRLSEKHDEQVSALSEPLLGMRNGDAGGFGCS